MALLAVLSGCLGIALFLAGIPGLCADDFMRMYLAVRWAYDPVALQVAIWPPLQSYLYGGPLFLGVPALYLGHAFSALFAGLAVYLAGRLTFSITSDSRAALFAALLVLTAPIHVLLSTSMLAEPMYSVWALALALSVWKWLSMNSNKHLWMALAFCTLLTMSRLDGWPIALGLAAFLVYRERSAAGLGYALLAIAFPVTWLLLMVPRFGTSTALFESYARSTALFLRSDSATHFNALWKFLCFYPLETCAAGMIVLREKENGALRWLAILVWGTLFLQFLITLQRGPELFAPRILVVPGLLGSVVAGAYLARLRARTAVLLVGIQLIAGGSYLSRYHPEYDREMAEIGKRFSRSSVWRAMPPNETVGSDLPTWKLPVVALLSGRPDVFFQVALDPASSTVALPYPESPRTFLIDSPEILRVLKTNLPEAEILPLGSVTFLTSHVDLVEDLRDVH